MHEPATPRRSTLTALIALAALLGLTACVLGPDGAYPSGPNAYDLSGGMFGQGAGRGGEGGGMRGPPPGVGQSGPGR